jgi:hypothetical protein
MTKTERRHLSAVAELGCIVCMNLGLGGTPAEIHHIRDGQGKGQRASHFETIPLCPFHHRTGGHGNAVHAGRETWEAKYGTERKLLAQVIDLIGAEVV